jgi:integrase
MGIKESTIRSRNAACGRLIKKHGERKLSLVNDQHIAAYFEKESERRGPSSMATTHAILNAFYTFCVQTGRLRPQQNVMLTRRAPRGEKRDMERIPVYRWPQLLACAQESDPRDRVLVAMGLYTLLRDQEMAALRLRDVDLNAGHIRARIPKTDDLDLVAISADLDRELRTWYIHYQNRVGPLEPNMLLLPARRIPPPLRTSRGTWMASPHSSYDPYASVGKCAAIVTPLFKQIGYRTRDESGKSTGMGAHTLRRSGARAYYDYFVSQGRADALRVVQTMLHHKNAEMTQHYIGLREDRQTRDQLVRGVTIFGLHELKTISRGVDHGDTEGQHQVM